MSDKELMPISNPKTLLLLNAINHWLEDIFGEGTRLSDLLTQAGLNEAEIEGIKTLHLASFIEAVLKLIGETTDKVDGERRNEVMMRHYGLIDGEAETLKAIGDDVGLSRERIRQLVDKRLQLYRHSKRKEQFISELHRLAREILDMKS